MNTPRNRRRANHRELFQFDLAVIESLRLPSGLIVAAPGAAYDRVWIRDCCQIAWAMWQCGKFELARSTIQAIADLYYQHACGPHGKVMWRIREGRPWNDKWWKYLHPIYNKDGSEIGMDWGFNQNDAIGLFMLIICKMGRSGLNNLRPKDLELLQSLVTYLVVIRFWEEDSGIWEEGPYINTPSICSCLAGLNEASRLVFVPKEVLTIGRQEWERLGRKHSPHRLVDLSQLQLFYPLAVSRDLQVLGHVEQALTRPRGMIRYIGDSYECGDDGSEAEWPLGFLWCGLAWLELSNREKAKHYLEQADDSRLPDGLLPESYRTALNDHGEPKSEPCPHLPLGWTHALAASLRHRLKLT